MWQRLCLRSSTVYSFILWVQIVHNDGGSDNADWLRGQSLAQGARCDWLSSAWHLPEAGVAAADSDRPSELQEAMFMAGFALFGWVKDYVSVS